MANQKFLNLKGNIFTSSKLGNIYLCLAHLSRNLFNILNQGNLILLELIAYKISFDKVIIQA